MRLISLEINNFRVIKSAKIDFPDKVIAIVGKNGVGKSSIIEAFSWALYGNQAARSGKDEIKSTFALEKEDCVVRVTFFINEEQYTVVRKLVGRSNRAEVELFRGEESESVGVNETKSHVGQLLGLDWKGFLSSFLARQSELNALSDLVPSKRKDHIAGMLGIEKLDKAMQLLKQDTKLYKERTLFLERSLSEKETIDRLIKEIELKLQTIEAQLIPHEKKFQLEQKNFEESNLNYKNYSEKRILFLKAEAELKAQQTTLKLLQDQNINLDEEQSKLAELKLEMKELLSQHEKLKDIPSLLEDQKVLKSSRKYYQDLSLQHQAVSVKIEQINLGSSKSILKLEKLESELNSFPDNLENDLQQQNIHRDEKRSRYSSLKTEIERLGIDIEKLKKQQLNISNLKSESVCERCHRPLGDDFEAINEHIENEIMLLNNSLLSKNNSLEETLKEGDLLKKVIEKLESSFKEQILLKPAVETVKKEIVQAQQLEKENVLQKEEISKKLSELGSIEFDEKEFDRLTEQFKLFEQNRNKITRYQGQLERLPVLFKEIEKLRTNIITTQEEITNKIENLESIGYSEENFKNLTQLYSVAQTKFEESKDALLEIKKEKELTALSLKEKQQQQEIFKKSAQEFEKNKTDHYYGEKLGSLFSLYRHDIIASIRPTLADISSRLFNEMTGNKYNLVELDEKYELRVMDNGQYYGVERFSGGEKDLANLCLRLAISLSLTESAGLSRSFIILDEVFGSQDNERKSLILTALANLKNRFPQIILITHIEDIKDGVEQIIEVRQNEFGHSEVVINGA